MKIRNVTGRPRGIGVTGQIVEPGEEIEVADDLGRSLLEQPARWAPVDGDDTVAAVKKRVGDDPVHARDALAVEQAKGDNARSTLIDALTKIIESEED